MIATLAHCLPSRKFKLRQVWQLEVSRIGDEEFGRKYELAQDFRAMVISHQAKLHPCWIEESKASRINKDTTKAL